jgi:hypothetical protein
VIFTHTYSVRRLSSSNSPRERHFQSVMSSRGKAHPDTERSQSRKRQRIETACNRCKAKKTKCDGIEPACSRCKNLEADCVYGGVSKRGKGKTLYMSSGVDDRKLMYDSERNTYDLLRNVWRRWKLCLPVTRQVRMEHYLEKILTT